MQWILQFFISFLCFESCSESDLCISKHQCKLLCRRLQSPFIQFQVSDSEHGETLGLARSQLSCQHCRPLLTNTPILTVTCYIMRKCTTEIEMYTEITTSCPCEVTSSDQVMIYSSQISKEPLKLQKTSLSQNDLWFQRAAQDFNWIKGHFESLSNTSLMCWHIWAGLENIVFNWLWQGYQHGRSSLVNAGDSQIHIQWNLSWETTAMRDPLSWRTTSFGQKVLHSSVYEPVTKDHLSWETIFLWSMGWSFKTGSIVYTV